MRFSVHSHIFCTKHSTNTNLLSLGIRKFQISSLYQIHISINFRFKFFVSADGTGITVFTRSNFANTHNQKYKEPSGVKEVELGLQIWYCSITIPEWNSKSLGRPSHNSVIIWKWRIEVDDILQKLVATNPLKRYSKTSKNRLF